MIQSLQLHNKRGPSIAVLGKSSHSDICSFSQSITVLPGPVTPGSTSVFFTWRRKRDPCQGAQTSSARPERS